MKYRPKHKKTHPSLRSEAHAEARKAADQDPSVNFHEELRLCLLERGLKA